MKRHKNYVDFILRQLSFSSLFCLLCVDDDNWVEVEVEVEGLRDWNSRNSSPFPVTENVIKMPGSCERSV